MVPVITPLIAMLLPMFVLYRSYKDRPVKRAYLYSVGSFTSALIAVCIEVETIRRRVWVGDLSGIKDTIDAVLVICIITVVATVLLNLLALTSAYSK